MLETKIISTWQILFFGTSKIRKLSEGPFQLNLTSDQWTRLPRHSVEYSVYWNQRVFKTRFEDEKMQHQKYSSRAENGHFKYGYAIILLRYNNRALRTCALHVADTLIFYQKLIWLALNRIIMCNSFTNAWTN